MKKITLLVSLILITACSGVKQTEQALYSGSYDSAIEKAVSKLQNNINRKNSDEYVVLLEEAYAKANRKDMNRIALLEKDGNAAYFEEIYNLYVKLDNRQKYIQPLLPLQVTSERRTADIKTVDYSNRIVTAKSNLSEYLYQLASNTLGETQPKYVYRNVYEDLKYLNRLNPGYKNTGALMQQALEKGTEYIMVNVQNSTNVIIPVELEQDLLNFNSYGLSSDWTVFHSNPSPDVTYDYQLTLDFQTIAISPEFVKETKIIKEKQIVDGKTYVLDKNGKRVKDSLGNYIQVDKYKTIVASVSQFTQTKSAQVTAVASLFSLTENEMIDSYPLSSEFIFENNYATYRGDSRALEKNYLDMIALKALAFPTNEQMVYDAGEDLKNKMKHIMKKYTL